MFEIAELDFGAIDTRMGELVDWLSAELDAPRGCCGELDELTANAAQLTGEEKLFYILLSTHFASPQTAREFHERLDWTGLLQSDTSRVRAVAADFFQERRLIVSVRVRQGGQDGRTAAGAGGGRESESGGRSVRETG